MSNSIGWCDITINPAYGCETFRWLVRLTEYGSGLALIFARAETQGFHTQIWDKAYAIFFFGAPLLPPRHG